MTTSRKSTKRGSAESILVRPAGQPIEIPIDKKNKKPAATHTGGRKMKESSTSIHHASTAGEMHAAAEGSREMAAQPSRVGVRRTPRGNHNGNQNTVMGGEHLRPAPRLRSMEKFQQHEDHFEQNKNGQMSTEQQQSRREQAQERASHVMDEARQEAREHWPAITAAAVTIGLAAFAISVLSSFLKRKDSDYSI